MGHAGDRAQEPSRDILRGFGFFDSAELESRVRRARPIVNRPTPGPRSTRKPRLASLAHASMLIAHSMYRLVAGGSSVEQDWPNPGSASMAPG